MGVVVRGRAGVVGDRHDCLSAPPHRSGVSRTGGGVYNGICADWLEVELCGDGAPHSRTRKGERMRLRYASADPRGLRDLLAKGQVTFESHQRTAESAPEFQLNGNACFNWYDSGIPIGLECVFQLDGNVHFNPIEKMISIKLKHGFQLNGNQRRVREMLSCSSYHLAA